ncbi:DeoR/GlpR family DNA-binding transcription regulator [Clostridium sp. CCUG 7971]|uniref:DeoR/GlpR family DNA-binding transcription regulator n=1 Tax=Clostridium sp. CCUG 7971 TaxID=2811414 RepID=UPI001ABAA27A|nr:DeoR/GlpR family DNA-binding transcription regulator [Clostridium sp. CCUG 7971]MBO3445537.1 DeoR/GlpR transcriptional regulator [Clostridium sp. CCUG 7971]
MLKRERLVKILNKINNQGIVTVNEIINDINVSDMTVRRYLDELDKSGKIIRIHGGAQSISYAIDQELSHSEKLNLQIDEKEQIAKVAASYIHDGDTVFLGPGTTIELLAHHLIDKRIRIVTNNYPVFDILKQSISADIIITGGDFRKNTGALVGPIANSTLKNLNFTKAFVSSNGIHNEDISTYSVEEGEAQRIALNNSRTKYLVADNKKLNKDDFYVFYDLHDIDYLITDYTISKEVKQHYEQYVDIIVADRHN